MTATPRKDFSTLIHKGQRRERLALTTSAGTIDSDEAPDRPPDSPGASAAMTRPDGSAAAIVSGDCRAEAIACGPARPGGDR
jgi:hypothetical protein